MSTYTVTVKQICDAKAGLTAPSTYDKIDGVIAKVSPLIFGNYEIFDESYRTILNHKILRHYLMDEIGQETVALWQFYLNQRMQEIMPYYNQLYKTTLWEIDPFSNMDYTVEHDGSSDDTAFNESVDEEKNSRTEESTNLTESGRLQKGIKSTEKNENNTQNTASNGKTTDSNRQVSNGRESTQKNTNTSSNDTLTNNDLTTKDTYNNLKTVESGAIKHNYDSDTTSSTRTIFNDTPQGNLQNPDSVEFATNVTNITDKSHKGGVDTDNYDDKTSAQTGSIEHKTTGGTNKSVTSNATDKNESTSSNESNSLNTSSSINNTDTKDNKTLKESQNDTNNEDYSSLYNGDVKDNYTSDKKHTSGDVKRNENEYLDHYKGRNGLTMAEALQKYRETLINIDMMVINELKDLFMCIY